MSHRRAPFHTTWRGAARRTLVGLACGLAVLSGAGSSPLRAAEPSTPPPVPAPVPPPSQAARDVVKGCIEHRYSDVGTMLHPTLRRTWITIGYTVREYCDLLTRDDTLTDVRILNEERVGNQAIVYLTYVYRDGSEKADRAGFLQDRGIWKLAN